MNYNDFQILSNEEYEIINNHFLQTQKHDRKTLLNEICLTIVNCRNSCHNFYNNVGLKLKTALNECLAILSKIYENYSTTFNIEIKSNEIKNISLFSFVNNIISAIHLNTNWILIEEKEYYKNLGKKTNIELFDIVNKLLKSLNESSFYFFKHM